MGAMATTAEPLGRHHMPVDYRISLDRYVGRAGFGGGYREGEQRIPGDFGPVQRMHGFEGTYRNIIDYIVRITHRIWEDRDVEYILDTYGPESRTFDDYGLQYGNQKIVDDTHHTTGAFSNIQLIADEVIWAGDDKVGFHSSHRTLIRGTNDGPSKYGPATGKDVDILVIANCVSKNNVIFLEHVLYNNSSLLLQLGNNLDEAASRMAKAPPAGWPRDAATWQALRAAARPDRPICEAQPQLGFDVDRFSREVFAAAWGSGDVAGLAPSYAPDFEFQGATNRTGRGLGDYGAMLAQVRAAFGEFRPQVDEVYWMGNDANGYLNSVRWSAEARHTSAGRYGEPTGAAVQLWGITQQRIEQGRITREWCLFNELDLMMQIAAARRN